MQNPVVTFTMQNGKTFQAELYPDKAPNTVNNFLSLVGSGFYDGLTFHRVIEGFMIQGGDPAGSGMGGPGYTITGEFRANGFLKKRYPPCPRRAVDGALVFAGQRRFAVFYHARKFFSPRRPVRRLRQGHRGDGSRR